MTRLGYLSIACTALAALGPSGPALAGDEPYGSDGLTYLVKEVRESKGRIVHLRDLKAQKTADNSEAWLYLGTVERDLSREAPLPAPAPEWVGVAVLRNASNHPPDVTEGGKAVAFLYPPMDLDETRLLGVGGVAGVPVALSVSGTFGLLAADGIREKRVDAIETYLRAQPAERIVWAESHLEDADPYLQRSAVLELSLREYKANVSGLLKVCGRALQSPRVAPSNKGVIIEILGGMRSEAAKEPLRKFLVANEGQSGFGKANLPTPVKASALKAIAGLPRGTEDLTQLMSNAPAEWIRVESARYNQALAGAPVGGAAPRDLLGVIQSGRGDARREATESVRRYTYNEETGKALAALVRDDKERDAVRQIGVDCLGSFNTNEAAKSLAAIAGDTSLPDPLRSAAVLAVARMKTEVGASSLFEMARTFLDPRLKNQKELAEGLMSGRNTTPTRP